jgi:hypothetical protein
MAADTPTGSAAGLVPSVTLGPGFTPTAFAPGRYATAIQRTMHGTHALQVLSEDSTAAFMLELAADGTATACRGWRYEFRNNGPQVRTADHYREQQGYRGHYTVNGGIAEVALERDDTVCPHVFEGELALARAPRVTLRCVVATPAASTTLVVPVLLCQPSAGKPLELEPHMVESIAPAGWFVLGSGSGLRVWTTGRPPGAQAGEDVKVTLKPADPPLTTSVWEQAF